MLPDEKTVRELSREQLTTLKINYLDDYLIETENRCISVGERAEIHSIVSDETIFAAFGNYLFTDDDFLCSAQ